jgi:GxxExxY protein
MRQELTEQIIAAAMEVHRGLGPGLLKSSYEECLCQELSLRNIPFLRKQPLPVKYKGVAMDCGYTCDLIVDSKVLLEIRAVEAIEPIHEAQLLTYLRLSGCSVGLLINFNVITLTEGIRRRVINYPEHCLCHELSLQALPFVCQQPLPVAYKGMQLDCGYRLDVIVNSELLLELKAVDKLASIHEAQLLTYLRLANLKAGRLINFNVTLLKEGLRRRVLNYPDRSSFASSASLR